MRIGIYLGRHSGAGGGIGVYVRSLVECLEVVLESAENHDLQVVIYGDRTVLTGELFKQLGKAQISWQVIDSIFPNTPPPFTCTPNPPPTRLVFRIIPFFGSRYFALLVDQLLLPIFIKRDRLDLFHATSNLGILWCNCLQVVTVHDLFQAWPVGRRAPASAWSIPFAAIQVLFRMYYRLFFSLQFKHISHVIADCSSTVTEIHRRYRFPYARTSTIPLGIDRHFYEFWQSIQSGQLNSNRNHWAARHGLGEGYVLILASADPRKNLTRALQAWQVLSEEQQKVGLLIVHGDSRSKRLVSELIPAGNRDYVWEIDWVSRAELPSVYYGAGVLLVPSLAEGFGLPVSEALSIGLPVVTSAIDGLPAKNADVFLCNPEEIGSIAAALQVALRASSLQQPNRSQPYPAHAGGKHLAVAPLTNGNPRPRTMADAVEETFALYRKVV